MYFVLFPLHVIIIISTYLPNIIFTYSWVRSCTYINSRRNEVIELEAKWHLHVGNFFAFPKKLGKHVDAFVQYDSRIDVQTNAVGRLPNAFYVIHFQSENATIGKIINNY